MRNVSIPILIVGVPRERETASDVGRRSENYQESLYRIRPSKRSYRALIDGQPMGDTQPEELLHLNQRLLDAITSGDWAVYQELCDPTLTAFEPEAKGQLVQGFDFHHFYFKLGGRRGEHQTTMCSPNVRTMGDAAVVAYVRLNQRDGEAGARVGTAAWANR